MPIDTYISAIKKSDVVQIVPVDENILLKSVDLQWSHRDPVDRIMVALALNKGCSIVTKNLIIKEFYQHTIW